MVTETGGKLHGGSKKPIIFFDWLSSADTDTNLYFRFWMVLVILRERILYTDGARHGRRCRFKGNHKSISSMLYLSAIVMLEKVTGNSVVGAKKFKSVYISHPARYFRGAFHIGKHDSPKR